MIEIQIYHKEAILPVGGKRGKTEDGNGRKGKEEQDEDGKDDNLDKSSGPETGGNGG